MTELAEQVRQRYAAAARAVTSGHAQSVDSATSPGAESPGRAVDFEIATGGGCCTGPAEPAGGCCSGAPAPAAAGPAVLVGCDDESFGGSLYSADERDELPASAVLASLGCGNPTAVAELRAGETVLDLGSGGGIDVLLSARRVGPTGRAIGVDFTTEMLELARRNAAAAGVTNAEFVHGGIEDLPLPDASVDVVISNCVINLSVDKRAVFREIARVLRPGGRLGITDVVADDPLSPADRAARGGFVGCIAGALSFAEYRAELAAAGLTGIEVTATHQVADGMHSAIVKAARPPAHPDR